MSKTRTPKPSEMKQLREKLIEYGNNIPRAEAIKATKQKNRKQWLVIVVNGEILGAGRTYQKDWYEWVVKNAFVVPSAQSKGLASILYADLTDKAQAEGASIAEADIDSDNIASKVAAVRAGMRPVNSFRWTKKKSEKPADVYQEVFIPPSRSEVDGINQTITRSFQQRNKPFIPEILMPYPITGKKNKRY